MKRLDPVTWTNRQIWLWLIAALEFNEIQKAALGVMAMTDEYGSVLRDKMKESMSEPFVTLNRRRKTDKRWPLMHRIVATAIVILVSIEMAWQIYLKLHH